MSKAVMALRRVSRVGDEAFRLFAAMESRGFAAEGDMQQLRRLFTRWNGARSVVCDVLTGREGMDDRIGDASLTPRQLQIVRFLERYRQRHGVMPTLSEIGRHLRVTRVTVFEMIGCLERKGVIIRRPNETRGIEWAREHGRGQVPRGETRRPRRARGGAGVGRRLSSSLLQRSGGCPVDNLQRERGLP